MEKSSSLRPLRLGEQTKNFVFLGEAGSGKSEIAINFALSLHQQGGKEVHLFDLDMTKPLFRSRDQGEALAAMGIRFHCEQQFMDAPTVTGGVTRLLREERCYTGPGRGRATTSGPAPSAATLPCSTTAVPPSTT